MLPRTPMTMTTPQTPGGRCSKPRSKERPMAATLLKFAAKEAKYGERSLTMLYSSRL